MVAIGELERMVDDFVSGRMPVAEFETCYLDAFKNAERIEPEALFLTLDALFADVDAYCGDPAIRRPGDLDEAQLRERAAHALAKVRALRRGP